MKYLITKKQYNVLLEQQVPIPMSIPSTNPIFGNIIVMNKKYLGLPPNHQITPEYTKKLDAELAKKNIGLSQRTFLGSAQGFIPLWGDAVDTVSLIEGLYTGDVEKVNGGIIGLLSPHFATKAVTSFVDYLAEKLVGKEFADDLEKKRNEILNMGQHDREELFKRYGYGGYDKWVKDGKPPLH
jgi:hypothetical protein